MKIKQPVASRAQAVSPFIVMEILERCKALESEGQDIVHLEIGEPDFNPPKAVVAAAQKAIKQQKFKYTHSLGLQELREAVAQHYNSKYKVDVEASQVIITNGTSPAMLLAFAVLLEPGAEVILTNPTYACYPNFLRFFNGLPKYVYLKEKNKFQLEIEAVKKLLNLKTKAIVINSPANPTGMLLQKSVMQALAELASPNRLIISDEIYHGLVYDGQKEHSILEFTKDAIVINGFSKFYAMTGWRLGYLIVPPSLVRPIQNLQQNFFIAANTVAQWAAISALTESKEELAATVKVYNERRLFLCQRLKALGFSVPFYPEGAFYLLVNCRHLNPNSYELALKILTEAKVALTPGIDFGDGAEGYLRFCYATDLTNLKEGCLRLEQWLKANKYLDD